MGVEAEKVTAVERDDGGRETAAEAATEDRQAAMVESAEQALWDMKKQLRIAKELRRLCFIAAAVRHVAPRDEQIEGVATFVLTDVPGRLGPWA